MGREGVCLLNTWDLIDIQMLVPRNVWDKLEGIQSSHRQLICIYQLELQCYKQTHDETVEDFYSRCKLKATQYKHTTPALSEDHTIEQLTDCKDTQGQLQTHGADEAA